MAGAGTTGPIAYSSVVGLSHVIHQDIPMWPGDPPVEYETMTNFKEDGYYLRRFSMGEHSATHMTAPKSFLEGGAGIDTYCAESLVVPAVVIDARDKAASNPDYSLTKDDVLAWETLHGRIPAGSVALLYTGWQEKWDDSKAYLNRDASGQLHFPGFGNGATRILLDERGVVGIGIDTHGVDPGWDTTYSTSVQVLERPRIVLENLTNLDRLPPTGATLVIGILLLRDGSGSPAAVTAFAP